MLANFILYGAGFLAFLALLQKLHIFPGAIISKCQRTCGRRFQSPLGVESYSVTTEDGNRIEVWAMECNTGMNTRLAPNGKPYIALIFHGNAAPMGNFILLQLWAAEQGIKSYTFDYRGYGNSTGWPSERGI